MALTTVFSEYELREMAIKFSGENAFENADCVGSCEEEMEARTVTKKCRGVVKKSRTKGTGNGKLKLSMHMPYDMYLKAYGMKLDTLIEGVSAYGENSVHESMAITQRVFDEDGVEKLKAYPNCMIQTGVARKIENGAEEVAEIELEVAVMPDEYGNGMYEALAAEATAVTATWMTGFDAKKVQKSA